MSVEMKVPSLGESITEATIAKWFKKEGEYVNADETLVELETDKVTLEVNATSSGILKEIKAKEGDTVKVGQILGVINEAAGKPASNSNQSAAAQTPPAAVSSTQAETIASPAAKKIATEQNISLEAIAGSGKSGRITKEDVMSAASGTGTTSLAVTQNDRLEERVRMTRLRKTIAERLKDSQNTAAILTTFNEIDMSHVIALRNQYKDMFEKKHKVKLGFMSFFAKAAVTALQEIPAVNASIEGDDIVYRNYCDIGVAVGTEQGLIVPVLRNAEKLSFADIEKKIADFGKRAREGKISIAELTGGTFTISNGGVYGSLLSTPIINPPQSGILGMHKTQERPVAVNGQVVIRPMMYVALSYDHRIIDGKEAVTFLIRIKECIESPERLLFDL